VIASWGRRRYGFGKPVNWGDLHIDRLGYLRGITIFARKWRETLYYLERLRRAGELTLYSYRELTETPQRTLRCVLHDLQLPEEPYISALDIRAPRGAWREEIPPRYWLYVRLLTWMGDQMIRNLEMTNRQKANGDAE